MSIGIPDDSRWHDLLGKACQQLEEQSERFPRIRFLTSVLRHIERVAKSPFRIAILGETNAGKSSLANTLIGTNILPALPYTNTRLPTLSRYAPAPEAVAVSTTGGKFILSGGNGAPSDPIDHLEVGLPAERLRGCEILDLPGSANPLVPLNLATLFAKPVHLTIWATVATQAWRESERLSWLGLRPRIRRTSLLVVTHCDQIRSEADIGFVYGPGGPSNSAEAFLAKVDALHAKFSGDRDQKAARLIRHLATRTLARLEEAA
jgi:hypothetical protein